MMDGWGQAFDGYMCSALTLLCLKSKQFNVTVESLNILVG